MIISDYSNHIGSIAAILTTVAFIPQVIQSYKTRDLSSISLPMYSIFTAGVAMWLIYGVLKHDLPLIAANSVTLCLAATVLILKVFDKH